MNIFQHEIQMPEFTLGWPSRRTLFEIMITLALLTVAWQVWGCDYGVVYPQHVRKAEELCANNDGIRKIYNARTISRDENPVFQAEIQCNNDALFLHAEFVDVIDNG